MKDTTVTTMRDRLTLAADGCLITAGAFAAMMGVAFALDALGVAPLSEPGGSGMDAILSWLSWLLQVGGLVVGPVLVWVAYRRRFSVGAVLGALVGFAASGAAVMAAILPALLLDLVVGLFTASEAVGPVAYLVLISTALFALIAWLDADAIRDLKRERRQHAALDIGRLVTTLAVIGFAVAVVLLTWPAVDPEPWAFLLVACVLGAVVVTLADVGFRLARSRADHATPAHA